MARPLSTEKFIQKAKEVHGNKYDYSLVTYIKDVIKVKIICYNHGEFEQRPSAHLSGQACIKCIHESYTMNTFDFISKANLVHDNKYDYSLVNYTKSTNKVKIICPYHGTFEQEAVVHLRGCNCPKCQISKGEYNIENWLNIHNIKFETQKKFVGCKFKRLLPFDFYIPDHNICIEFDGEQHFKIPRRSKDINKNIEQFNKIKINDKIKDEYCNNNNIHLIRIPYTEIDNIEQFLVQLL